MTEAQEAILDRLMVANKIGVQWPSGPLGLAIQAMQSRVMRGRKDVSQTLGYPMLLCQALHGASSALGDIDDRRKLAVTFFSALAPRPRKFRLTPRRHAEVALWCGQWIHPLVCREDCPYLVRVLQAVRDALVNHDPDILRGLKKMRCPAVLTRDWSRVTWPRSPERTAIEVLNEARAATFAVSDKRWPGKMSNRAARDAAHLVGLVRGVEGTVDFCLALAREVGL
jgi:hypothetical protein